MILSYNFLDNPPVRKNIARNLFPPFQFPHFGFLMFSRFRRFVSPFRWVFVAVSKPASTFKMTKYKNCSEAEKMPPAILPEKAIICIGRRWYFFFSVYVTLFHPWLLNPWLLNILNILYNILNILHILNRIY